MKIFFVWEFRPSWAKRGAITLKKKKNPFTKITIISVIRFLVVKIEQLL